MSFLYLVRHGQADRLGKDYDNLTNLGWEQAKALGGYFLNQRIEFDSIFTGTLNRQKQTASGITQVFESEKFCFPSAIESEYWNEFDPRMWLGLAAKIRNVDADFAKTYEDYKQSWEKGETKTRDHFQTLIQKVLSDWVNGIWDPVEPYTFLEYIEQVQSGLQMIPNEAKSTLIVSSSTPVAIVMGLTCGIAPRAFPVFMKHILNSSLSVFKKENGVWEPVSFNTTPHLMNPDQKTIL